MGRRAWAKRRFMMSLSIPAAEPRTPERDVGGVGELEQALDGAVFAKGAVKDGEGRRRACRRRGWRHRGQGR